MTRENKLALVVGFALILFVGILVSDHFSIAQSQEAANLIPPAETSLDPALRNPDLLRFAPAASGEAPAAQLASSSRLVTPRSVPADPLQGLAAGLGGGGEPPAIRMPDLLADLTAPAASEPATPRGGLAEPQQRDLPFTFHDVRSGESLSKISQLYYGDQSMAAELARFNGLGNPDQLRAGHRLKVPTAGRVLGRPEPQAPPAPPPAAAPGPAAKQRTYVVAGGDVLSEIAQREMGSARHWRKLYEHNRDVIDDPDHLEVGVVLKIPG
jgi:nucleoid-associated protein YgaU